MFSYMTGERKRSSYARLLPKGRKIPLGIGSNAGAKVSVIYHTFIETCKMCCVSTLEYFKAFFKAIMQGRTDCERSTLSLATIGTQEHVTEDHRY